MTIASCFLDGWTSKDIICGLVIPALAALGTIAVAILAIWGDWWRARCAPAKLVLAPHNNLTGSLTTIGEPMPGGGFRNVRNAYFFHLKVVNEKPWIVPRNCRVLLKAMSQRGPDGDFRPIPMAVPLQYVWAPSETTPPVLSVEDEQALDFGRLIEGEDAFRPVLYSRTNNFQGDVKAKEAMRYSLQIVSDKFVAQQYQVFEVAWDGVWSNNPEQMRTQHLVIKEIRAPEVYVP